MLVLNDFKTNVIRALSEIDPKWASYGGLVVCGTHSPHDVESIIHDIKTTRFMGMPFLGICAGHQLAAIEYARNVLDIPRATSEEFSSDGEFVVRKLPKLKVGLHDGESYWNNYEVVPEFESIWKKADNFITVQFHPEYQSSKDNPHPILKHFLEVCKNQK